MFRDLVKHTVVVNLGNLFTKMIFLALIPIYANVISITTCQVWTLLGGYLICVVAYGLFSFAMEYLRNANEVFFYSLLNIMSAITIFLSTVALWWCFDFTVDSILYTYAGVYFVVAMLGFAIGKGSSVPLEETV